MSKIIDNSTKISNTYFHSYCGVTSSPHFRVKVMRPSTCGKVCFLNCVRLRTFFVIIDVIPLLPNVKVSQIIDTFDARFVKRSALLIGVLSIYQSTGSFVHIKIRMYQIYGNQEQIYGDYDKLIEREIERSSRTTRKCSEIARVPCPRYLNNSNR